MTMKELGQESAEGVLKDMAVRKRNYVLCAIALFGMLFMIRPAVADSVSSSVFYVASITTNAGIGGILVGSSEPVVVPEAPPTCPAAPSAYVLPVDQNNFLSKAMAASVFAAYVSRQPVRVTVVGCGCPGCSGNWPRIETIDAYRE